MRKGSLGRRFVATLVIGEVVFALIIGVTVGTFGVLTAARLREEAIGQISGVVAAGLMPSVADQQEPQVKAQMASILEAAQVEDIESILILDSSGSVIASRGGLRDPLIDRPQKPEGPLSFIQNEQVVEQPIVIDGLEVASVYVKFAPPGLFETIRAPAGAVGLVLLAVVIVSGPWATWLVMRELAEPLADLGDYACRIADGDLETDVPPAVAGEIGDLQGTLKRMAEQLKERDDRLRGSYDNLTEAYLSLERAKLEIEQLAIVKSDFVAIASHEIRSPLSTITLYAERLQGGEISELDEATLDAVTAIGSASTRLGRVVSDLMDSALLERGLMPIEFRDVWLDEVVAEAVQDAGVLAQSRGGTARLDGDIPDLVIFADSLRLRQVFDNLLSNAIKYSPPGSEVVVRVHAGDDRLDVDVVDRGRGVPEAQLDRLFTLFGRVDFGDSRDTAGLGLGLAISARIVEAQGGHLSFRPNEDGQGSIFSVRLPRDGSSAPASGRTVISVVGERADA